MTPIRAQHKKIAILVYTNQSSQTYKHSASNLKPFWKSFFLSTFLLISREFILISKQFELHVCQTLKSDEFPKIQGVQGHITKLVLWNSSRIFIYRGRWEWSWKVKNEVGNLSNLEISKIKLLNFLIFRRACKPLSMVPLSHRTFFEMTWDWLQTV